MRWDITLLVQSVNLICVKKSVALIGLNIFFFASTAESRATFLKLVFDRVSKFGLRFEIQSSAFVFISKFITS